MRWFANKVYKFWLSLQGRYVITRYDMEEINRILKK